MGLCCTSTPGCDASAITEAQCDAVSGWTHWIDDGDDELTCAVNSNLCTDHGPCCCCDGEFSTTCYPPNGLDITTCYQFGGDAWPNDLEYTLYNCDSQIGECPTCEWDLDQSLGCFTSGGGDGNGACCLSGNNGAGICVEGPNSADTL